MIQDMLLEVKMLVVDVASALGFPQVGLLFDDARVRLLAVQRMGATRHIGRLVRIAQEDPVPRVREEALLVIEEIGVLTPKVIGMLQTAITDPDEWVRRSAKRMLRRARQTE